MSGWTESTILEFMQRQSEHFGEDIKQIKAAEQEWICKRFTDKLFSMLDWVQEVNTPYVDVEYEGKGDISAISVKDNFCLTPKQCADIANYIASRIYRKYSHSYLNELDSFSVLSYIRYGTLLETNWIYLLEQLVKRALVKGGNENEN